MDIKAVCLLFLFASASCYSRSPAKKEKARSFRNRGESLEQLFTVLDLTFLSAVWPKISNGMHLNLGHFCWEDLTVFFKDLSEGRAWAFNVADASGRYQGGVFGGGRFWLGSKRRCRTLDHEFLLRDNSTLDVYQEGEYLAALLQKEKLHRAGGKEWRQLVQRDDLIKRLVAADNRPPYRLTYSAATMQLNLTKITITKTYDVTLGLCLPRSCTPRDINSIIAFSIMINDNLRSNRTVPRITKITSLRHIEPYDIGTDTGAIILIVLTLVLLVISMAATAIELNLIKCKILRPHSSRSVNFNLRKHNNTSSHRKYFDDVKKKTNENIFKDAYPNLGKLNKIVDMNDGSVVKSAKPNAAPPTITLDVMERAIGSCNRCGKYKKQCNNTPAPTDNMTTTSCPRVKYCTVTSQTSQERKTNFFKKLLLCFSLRYSLRRIFNTSMANKDLAVMHLLRIVATLWVMYVHVAVIVNYVAEDAGEVKERNDIYYTLATGTLAFDTLLFVSGLFSSHHFFYLKSHYTVEELVSFGGPCGQILQFVCFVTNRIIRLLPSYAYAILLSGVMARVSRYSSALSLPDNEGENCDYYWWRNLLYIANIYPPEERCMQISWYLSAETQLHMCGALLCALWGGARGRVAAALAAGALLAATAADVSSAYIGIPHVLPGLSEAYIYIIERPWARVVPYFVGVFTGWLVHKTNGRVNVSKVTTCCLWSAAISTMLTSALVPWLALDWLTAWVHVTWPVALLWPAVVCATNYAPAARRVLDCGSLAALSRLCYSMLLLHGCVARVLLLAADAALCSHGACIWSYFAGTTSLTVLGALLLSALVEIPCCSLLRKLSDCATV